MDKVLYLACIAVFIGGAVGGAFGLCPWFWRRLVEARREGAKGGIAFFIVALIGSVVWSVGIGWAAVMMLWITLSSS